MRAVLLLIALVLVLAGCGVTGPANPRFSLSPGQAKAALEEMRTSPRRTTRPILVLAGFHDPGFGAAGVTHRLRRQFIDQQNIITIPFFVETTLDACADKVARMVDAAFPGDDPEATVEVDVIGISMGGLIARHAARERNTNAKRLRIARLFTVGTPHRGARLAGLPTLDRRQLDMRKDSDFIAALNTDPTSHDFEVIPYARLGDAIVGVDNTAPPGEYPWWVPNLPFQPAHLLAASDPRIMADIVRRLRNQPSFTAGEPMPPPGHDATESERARRISPARPDGAAFE